MRMDAFTVDDSAPARMVSTPESVRMFAHTVASVVQTCAGWPIESCPAAGCWMITLDLSEPAFISRRP
jgi:hypothetical protein